jgi:hypothetical protein
MTIHTARTSRLLRPIEAVAPSAWASFLINGDASGLEPDEVAAALAWVKRQAMGFPVSCEDAGYCKFHDALNEAPYAADCQSFVFLAAEG